jgi:hypothetical protein
VKIVIVHKDFHYHCPFSGSCNSCGILNEGINTCPTFDEETDDIIAPKNCPLLTNSITIELDRNNLTFKDME